MKSVSGPKILEHNDNTLETDAVDYPHGDWKGRSCVRVRVRLSGDWGSWEADRGGRIADWRGSVGKGCLKTAGDSIWLCGWASPEESRVLERSGSEDWGFKANWRRQLRKKGPERAASPAHANR